MAVTASVASSTQFGALIPVFLITEPIVCLERGHMNNVGPHGQLLHMYFVSSYITLELLDNMREERKTPP